MPTKIEKNIPAPLPVGALAEMGRDLARADIGDSVWVPGGVKQASSAARAVGSGWYRVQAEERDGQPGARLWKVAHPPGAVAPEGEPVFSPRPKERRG